MQQKTVYTTNYTNYTSTGGQIYEELFEDRIGNISNNYGTNRISSTNVRTGK